MISNTYANSILKTIMGQESLNVKNNIYLGICADEPKPADGAVTTEPTADSYRREPVVKTTTTNGIRSITTNMFAAKFKDGNGEVDNPLNGVIRNTDEIQMKTAMEDFVTGENGEKIVMGYWFLSDSDTKGSNAYIWGRIKDVVMPVTEAPVSTTEGAGENLVRILEVNLDTLLNLKAGETYAINWDGKDEDVNAVLEGESIRLVPVVESEDKERSFNILYTVTNALEGTSHLRISTPSAASSHDVAIYGYGIIVKRNNVPTFYKGELQASIDAQ